MMVLGRKLSPTPPTNRLSIEAPNEKDEGISDEEDPAELRILLELNEQVMCKKNDKKYQFLLTKCGSYLIVIYYFYFAS